MSKEFIRIQSSKTINVTGGLQNKDVTNPDAHIPDRLKVQPTWPKLTCLIKEGVGVYPAEIVDWNTVKALQKDGIITIGEFVDDAPTDVKIKKNDIITALEETSKDNKKARKLNLSEVADED